MLTSLRFSAWPPSGSRRIWLAPFFVACFVLVVASRSAGQLVVHDAATTARNGATAALNEQLYQLQKRQHDRILEMARRLSALTNLRKYGLTNVPLWRSHEIANSLFAAPYLSALSFG